MPEGLARVHVGQVHLDERDLHREQRVAQRDAGVRETRGIEDDEGDVARRRLVDPADQLGLGVALEGGEPVPGLGGELRHPLVDLLQGHVPVQPGLAHAQQVQVRTVEQQQVGHGPPQDAVRWREFSANCRQMATIRPVLALSSAAAASAPVRQGREALARCRSRACSASAAPESTRRTAPRITSACGGRQLARCARR